VAAMKWLQVAENTKLFSFINKDMMSEELQPLEITEKDKKRADEFKVEANALFANQDYERAVEKYSEAISYDPTNPVYFSNRSICNFRLELYGQALIDATTAIELDPRFVKAYYRKASAHMALGQLKESIQDFKQVLKVNNDQTTRQKLIQCQKEYKRIEFEKAIFSEAKTLTAQDQLGDVDAIIVEPAYEGPHLLTNEITLEFVKDLLKHMKDQKKLHPKYTYKLLLMAKEYFENRPTIEDIVIPEGSKITVCGDIHGQYYDLLNVFEINGLPSPENMYLWNGDFVDRGSFSVECILTLLCFKLLYPNSVYLSRGNHESDDMNRVYGFEGEVKAKYSQALFKLFSEIFNAIPLGNLIMNKILVIHGGLFSRDNVSMQELRDIDRFKQVKTI
jgi:serine/threonine-protein phosphatase 5